MSAGDALPLERAAAALEQARHGAHGAAIVLAPREKSATRSRPRTG